VNADLLAAVDGLAATGHDEWVDALCQLIDEGARRRGERAARGYDVADRHAYATWQDRWLDAAGWACASST
jgi:hypothetical protein